MKQVILNLKLETDTEVLKSNLCDDNNANIPVSDEK